MAKIAYHTPNGNRIVMGHSRLRTSGIVAALALLIAQTAMAAAPPAPAPGQGVARLRCTTSASALRDCGIVSEDPGELGLGQAALDLLAAAGYLPGLPPAGAVVEVDVPLTLAAAPQSAGPVYGGTEWLSLPTRQQFRGIYPTSALARKIAGTVVLNCKVSDQGAVKDCQIAGETPARAGFGQAALEAASHYYRYRPKQVDGHPVAGTATVVMVFLP